MLNIYDQEDRSIGVFSKNFIDFNIMGFKAVSSGVPSHKFLLLTDLHLTLYTFLIISNID